MRALTVPAWRFAVSAGRWDQFAKFGEFEKDGEKVVFDERTLGQMIENFAARKNDLGMDYEHQALNAPVNGQPAPALAWYAALALVVGGEVRQFATHDPAIQAPTTEGLADGLYGYRARVTPLGDQLLANYRYISPAFAVEGADEQGRSVGYDLLNVAATNTPFLDGMAPIEMRRIEMAARPLTAFDLRAEARESFTGDVITCPDCQKPGVKVIGISPRLADHDKPSGGRCPSSGKYVTEFTRLAEGRVPCPLCGGSGTEHYQSEGGRDRSVRCRGCNGERQVDEARAEQIKRDHPEWREHLMSRVGLARTSGYVYRLESGSDWRAAPDDDWETVSATVDGQVVGRRQIDGSTVTVIESGGRIYAALPQNVSMRRAPRMTAAGYPKCPKCGSTNLGYGNAAYLRCKDCSAEFAESDVKEYGRTAMADDAELKERARRLARGEVPAPGAHRFEPSSGTTLYEQSQSRCARCGSYRDDPGHTGMTRTSRLKETKMRIDRMKARLQAYTEKLAEDEAMPPDKKSKLAKLAEEVESQLAKFAGEHDELKRMDDALAGLKEKFAAFEAQAAEAGVEAPPASEAPMSRMNAQGEPLCPKCSSADLLEVPAGGFKCLDCNARFDINEVQKWADHAEPDGDEEKDAMAAMRRTLGLPPAAPARLIAAKLEATMVPMSDVTKIRRELDALKKERDDEKKAEADRRIQAFVDQAVRQGYPEGKRDALVRLARADLEAAREAVEAASGVRLTTRMTAHGDPIGKEPGEPVDLGGAAGDGDGIPVIGASLSKEAEKIAMTKKIPFKDAMIEAARANPRLAREVTRLARR